jgi:hypothetical protein
MDTLSGRFVPSDVALTNALLLVFVGELAFLMAYRAASVWGSPLRRALYARFPEPNAGWVGTIFVYAFFGLVECYVNTLRPQWLPVSIRNMAFTIVNPYLALFLGLSSAYRFGERRLLVLSTVAVVAMTLIGLISGMMENVVVPSFALVLATWHWRHQLRWRLLIGGALLFLVLNPVKAHYRALAWRPTNDATDGLSMVTDRLDKWQEALRHTWEDPLANDRVLDETSSRVSYLMALAQAVDWVPDMVPYREGEGAAAALLFFIPRAVWPDKPVNTELGNNQYAIAFRISTAEGVRRSTFGIYQPLDGFWDFGAVGAVGYLLLTGLIIGLLFGGHRHVPQSQLLLSLVFSCSFFQTLVGMFNLVASLFSLFVGAWIALRLLAMFSPARAPEPIAALADA